MQKYVILLISTNVLSRKNEKKCPSEKIFFGVYLFPVIFKKSYFFTEFYLKNIARLYFLGGNLIVYSLNLCNWT